MVCAVFDNRPILQNINAMGIAHGGETVCDHEACALATQVLQRLLHKAFGMIVECGSCFIEQQKWRVFQ